MSPPVRAGSLPCQRVSGWRRLLLSSAALVGGIAVAACSPGATDAASQRPRVAESPPVAAEPAEPARRAPSGGTEHEVSAEQQAAALPPTSPSQAAATSPPAASPSAASPSAASPSAAAPPPAASPPSPAPPAATAREGAERGHEHPDEPHPDAPAPALYVRLGDVLVPLGCRRPRGWRGGAACLPTEEDARVQLQLQPTLQGESATRSGSVSDLPFVLAGTSERGISLVKKERETTEANRPLLGFGTVGSNSPLRFTKAGAQRIRQEASGWCRSSRGICRGVAEKSLLRLSSRAAKPREQNDLIAQVRHAIAPLAETLPIKVIALFTVSVGGKQQRIADVEVDTANATSPKAAELQLPDSVHYLFAETARGFKLTGVARDEGFGLGEAGELLGAIDLDDDGTDELIVSWMYSEGRSWELIRRSGDKLIFVGGFTDGA